MSSSSPPPRHSPSQPHSGQQWRRGQQVRKPTASPNVGASSEHNQQSSHRSMSGKGTQPQQPVTVTKGAPAAAWGRAETGPSRGYANALVVPRGRNVEASTSLSQHKLIAAGGNGSPGGDASRASKVGSWGGVVGRGATPTQRVEAARPARQVVSHEEGSPPAPTKAAAVAWPSLSAPSSSRVSPSKSRPQPQPQPQPQSQPSQKEPHAKPSPPGGTVQASTARAWETTASRRDQSKPQPSPPTQQQQQQLRQQRPAQPRRAEMTSDGGKEAMPRRAQPLQLLSRPQEKSPSQGRPKEQSQQQYKLVKRKSNNKEKLESVATAPVPSSGGSNGKVSAASAVPSSKSSSTSKDAVSGASKKPGHTSPRANANRPKPSSNAITLSDLMPAGVKKGGSKNRSKGGGKDKSKGQLQQEETTVPAPMPSPAPVPTEDDFPPMAPPPLRSYPPLAAAATVHTRSPSPKKVRAQSSNDVANKTAAEVTDRSKNGGRGVKHAAPSDKAINRGLADAGRQSTKDKVSEKGVNSPSLLTASDALKKKKKKKKQVTASDLLAALPPTKMTADEEQMHLMRSMMLGMKKGAGTKANGQNDASSSFPAAAATKGKQRLGPRKKRLTTLKKKVLQERLRKWREKEEHEQKEQGAALLTPLDSESNVEAVCTVNDTVQSQQISSAVENGEYSDKINGARKIVYLSNFVEPDELDDDEEYEEIVGDVHEMAAKIGLVENVAVPRRRICSEELREEKKETSALYDHVGLVVVTFAKELDAIAAKDCWDGMVIGGAQVHASLSVPGRCEEDSEEKSNGLRDSPRKATLVLDNILGDDDFSDEDCLEESKADIMDMCNRYGRIDQFRIELEGDCKGLIYVDFVEGEQVATLAANDLNRKVIGGQVISARVVQFGNSDSSGRAPSHGAADEATVGAHVSKSTFIVALENILTEDDFMDEDCLQESKDDILELAREYGHVDEVYTEQHGSAGGCVYVRYHTGQEAANLAVTKLNGMVMGGQTVTAHLVGDIVLSNVLTEDDFLDDECLEESKSDIIILASKYGEVTAIQVASNAHYDDVAHDGLVYVSYREGEKVGKAAIEGLDGITIGGQRISAWSMNRSAEENVQTRTSHVTGNLANENDNASEQKHEERKEEAGRESNPEESEENAPAPMYSGDKIIPERYAACKRVPKIPNAVPNRSYASRIDSDAAVPLLNEMLGELMRFQLRAKDDANARARRRLVMGLREVARGLRAHKVKMVIMANNLDEYGVIDSKLEEILDLARDWDVPVLFELNKRKLGKALGKTIKVSVVGIQNADGAHQQFKKLQKLASLPRKAPPGKPGE